MDQNIFFITIGIFIIGFGAISFLVFDLRRKWRVVFGSASTHDNLLAKILQEHDAFKARIQKQEARLKIVEAISDLSVQKIGFIRFNPFSETGGDNSFALTLLDHRNNGVIISSLYAREGVRVYGKSIEGGKPKHPLSEEEGRSLQQALKE